MVVAHQVTEALKILVGAEGNLRSTLVIFDLWHNQYQMIDVSKAKAKDCKSCGTDASYPALTYKNSTKTEILCGRDTVQIRGKKFELTMLAKQLERFGEVNQNPFLVSVQTKAHRIVFFFRMAEPLSMAPIRLRKQRRYIIKWSVKEGEKWKRELRLQ